MYDDITPSVITNTFALTEDEIIWKTAEGVAHKYSKLNKYIATDVSHGHEITKGEVGEADGHVKKYITKFR